MGSWYNAAIFIRDLANYFTTEKEEQLLTKFIRNNGAKFGNSQYILTEATAVVDKYLAWTEKHLASLYQYLADRKTNSAASATISLVLVLFFAIFNFML